MCVIVLGYFVTCLGVYVRVFVYIYICTYLCMYTCMYLYLQLLWVGSCSHSVSKNAVFQFTNQSGQSFSGLVDSVHVGWYIVVMIVLWEHMSISSVYVPIIEFCTYVCFSEVYLCIWVYFVCLCV